MFFDCGGSGCRGRIWLSGYGDALLVPFLVLAVAYLVPQGWGLSAADYAALADEPQAVWVTVLQADIVAVILVGWTTVSFVIARSQHWPTWLWGGLRPLGHGHHRHSAAAVRRARRDRPRRDGLAANLTGGGGDRTSRVGTRETSSLQMMRYATWAWTGIVGNNTFRMNPRWG